MARQSAGFFALLGKHQVSSLVATVVDFSLMVVSVEALNLPPALATVVGAASGAITNFTLGRHWAFRATSGRARSQALRYALVSAASLLLNALGVYLVATVLGIHYLAARVAVAVLVSIGWNFPLHRHFVFADDSEVGPESDPDNA